MKYAQPEVPFQKYSMCRIKNLPWSLAADVNIPNFLREPPVRLEMCLISLRINDTDQFRDA